MFNVLKQYTTRTDVQILTNKNQQFCECGTGSLPSQFAGQMQHEPRVSQYHQFNFDDGESVDLHQFYLPLIDYNC